MLKKVQQYKILFYFSLILFIGVFLFSFGVKFFDPIQTKAAAKTWDGGGGDNNWCTATNWDDDALPTSTADITFDNATTIIVSGCDIEFYSLTIGGTSSTTLELFGNITTGTNITIANLGTLRQMNWVQQTISGNLVIASGGLLTHGDNYDSKQYKVDFKANNINVESGGSINVSYLGYEGAYIGEYGTVKNDPFGPGAGTSVSYVFNDYSAASGAGHCGMGGDSWNGPGDDAISGGDGYCDMVNINDLGSGGGGFINNSSQFIFNAGEGGGLIILEALDTITINGSVLSKGGDGNLISGAVGFVASGGGAGGAVQITADVISGTPTLFDVSGGNSTTSTTYITLVVGGGGGGGGCVSLFYNTSNSISYSNIIMNGGSGYQAGGAGILYIRQDGLDGDLYLNNNGNFGAQSQHGGVLTANSLTLKGGAIYNINEARTLTLSGSDPLAGGDGDSILFLATDGTLVTPISVILSNYVYVEDGAIWQNSSSTDVILKSGATFSQENFTTSSEPLWFDDFTIQSGGLLTHSDNSDEQDHVLNMKFNNLTVASGGEINVDGKGYDGGTFESDGYGPGGGINNSCNTGAGGGHGGDGASTSCSVGGTAYCSQYSPQTIGSGGAGSTGGAGSFYGGDGGGLIMLQILNDFTLNGTLTADGTNGGTSYGAGGGAGGGVWVRTKNLSGNLDKITANGGYSEGVGGSGGGGCVFVYYSDTYTFIGDIETEGGDNPNVAVGDIPGEDGTNFYNQEPRIVFNNFGQRLDGSKIADINITVDDADDNDDVQIKAEYKAGATCSESTSDPTLDTTVSSTFGTPVLNNDNVYQISFVTTSLGANTLGLTWPIDTDIPTADGLYCLQLTTNDGMSTGTFFATTTFDVVAPTVPGSLTVASQNDDSASLYFGATSTDTNFNQYLVYYSTSTPVTILNTEINSSTITALGLANYNEEDSFSINNLVIDTYYYANIWAYDLFGNSSSSTAEVNFVTDPDVPSGLVASVTKNSVTLSWSALVSGNPIEYQAWINLNSGTMSDWQTITNYTFTGLTAGTEYTLKVKSRNASTTEESAWSGTISASTSNDSGTVTPPPPPPPPEENCKDTSTCDNPSGLIYINGGDRYTNSKDVKISIDSDFVLFYVLSNSTDFSSLSFLPIESEVNFQLTEGDGEKTVYARFKNNQGTYDQFDRIILDTQKPILSGVEFYDGLVGDQRIDANFTGYVSDNLSDQKDISIFVEIPSINYKSKISYPERNMWEVGFLVEPGKYTANIVAQDGAGNETIIKKDIIIPDLSVATCKNYLPNITSVFVNKGEELLVNNEANVELVYDEDTNKLLTGFNYVFDTCPYVKSTSYVFYNIIRQNNYFYSEYWNNRWFGFSFSLIGDMGVNDGYIDIDDFPKEMENKVGAFNLNLRKNFFSSTNKLEFQLETNEGEREDHKGNLVELNFSLVDYETYCKRSPSPSSCQDSDNDGIADLLDRCPRVKDGHIEYNMTKEEFFPDFETYLSIVDTDGDDVGNYCDNCPNTENPYQQDTDKNGVGDLCEKIMEPVKDTDGDGILDNVDNCIYVRNFDQLDTDGDNWGDACDECVSDSNKVYVGICGCGTPDIDSDSDGVPNCNDSCPNDKNKTAPGICGCGILDEDKDNDGVICEDKCPYDSNKIQIGICGCGTPDIDSDSDGLMDCKDQCPNDNLNICEDLCPDDPQKRNPGSCGCGTPDIDSDSDGLMDCKDQCPNDPENKCNEEPPCVGPDCVPALCVGPDCGEKDNDSGGDVIPDFIENIINDLPEIILENLQNVFEFVSSISEITIESIKKVIDNPQVEAINKKYVAPALVGAGVANVAVGMGFGQLLAILRSIFAQPLLLSRLKKKKKWGVIYNAFTKEPISLATIRVLDYDTNKIIRTQVTDNQGRYLLILDPGKYKIEVDKSGFSGFSEYLMNKNEDAKYINLYHGGVINITEKQTNIDYNIPLDPNSENKEVTKLLRDKLLNSVKYIVSFSGLALTGISFIITPSAVVAAFFFAHLLFFSLFYKFSHSMPPPRLGRVLGDDNEPIENAVVRVFDSAYNKLVNSTITNQKGQYAVLVGPSTYYVTYEKPGFKQAKTDIIDLSSEKTNGMGGIIDLDEKLKKI